MANIELDAVDRYVSDHMTLAQLIEAASCVANAIHAGVGGYIQGSLMEDDLRKALGLARGDLVNIPKR